MTPEEGIEQADVMRRYYEQQTLPEEQRDILEYRERHCTQWLTYILGEPGWKFCDHEYRLRKRPQKKTVTVYLYRSIDGNLYAAIRKPSEGSIIGQAEITYEE